MFSTKVRGFGTERAVIIIAVIRVFSIGYRCWTPHWTFPIAGGAFLTRSFRGIKHSTSIPRIGAILVKRIRTDLPFKPRPLGRSRLTSKYDGGAQRTEYKEYDWRNMIGILNTQKRCSVTGKPTPVYPHGPHRSDAHLQKPSRTLFARQWLSRGKDMAILAGTSVFPVLSAHILSNLIRDRIWRLTSEQRDGTRRQGGSVP